MFWFKKKKRYEDLRDQLAARVSVEVPEHQRVKKEAVEEARQATDTLKEVINNNGFTLKIHIAAGGKR